MRPGFDLTVAARQGRSLLSPIHNALILSFVYLKLLRFFDRNQKSTMDCTQDASSGCRQLFKHITVRTRSGKIKMIRLRKVKIAAVSAGIGLVPPGQ